jgi:hypothetical protein
LAASANKSSFDAIVGRGEMWLTSA